ncbi:Phage repressor protein C, contains Cro/C1-type HTH and peptisase s24 domains [Hymenobacter daecheongensis DSM 21074]|uniref:Phage repressor protein C, contains Cro/C1-type HTH and peptisase s24 domains n=1 Tax=Hymenobacter daecheongensis DSM 21074 TaxID=1121955 RepID=A0A1M6HWY3_9BACT|nr:LexA family transcriptional regulator [Hymenobacter daecheongensis]SHJ26547.1 Phage repressor protein C, contains Cro/C1-type HTH and peptisase s24 domains [Hymenobacter daecheongensis DSM 21074]
MINTNLKFWRRELSLTQAQMAEKLNIKRSLVGAYEEGRAEPKLSTLVNMARLFGITLDSLVTNDFTKKSVQKAALRQVTPIPSDDPNPTRPAGNLRILALTVDKEQNENIELVPLKAAAGYLNGYADPEFIEELPKFRLPMLGSGGTYRAFEIAGDSMLPIASGTVIVGRYVDDWLTLKDGTPCIVVSSKEGIVFKRVFNRLKDGATLSLHSDNPVYSPYEINVEDVVEIWEAKSYISSTFPIADLSLSRLASIVLDLQQQVSTMRKV